MEPRYNEGPREWQNVFVTTRFVNLFEALCHIALYFTITQELKKIVHKTKDFNNIVYVIYIFI